MRTQLLVRLQTASDRDNPALEWCWLSAEGEPETIQSGFLSDLSGWIEQQPLNEQELPVVLLLPGDLAVSHQVLLNENQRRHWQQALPYLLEEQLAFDLESQYLVSSMVGGEPFARVACIEHSMMRQLLETFISAGVDPQRVVAESQLLEGKPGTLTVWVAGEQVLVAEQDNCSQQIDRAALSVIIPGLLAEGASPSGSLDEDDEELLSEQSTLSRIQVYAGSTDHKLIEQVRKLVAGELQVESVEREQASLLTIVIPALSQAFKRKKLLDFRTGPYKCTRRASRRWRQWRPVVVAASIWLGLEFLFSLGSGFYFQARTENLRTDNLATYQELRPNDRNVVDIRHRLTTFLRTSSIQKSTPEFLELLQVLSRVSGSEVGKTITPRTMDFNEANGRLSLDIKAISFDILNRYLEELRGAGVNARMETGNQDTLGVSARLIVRKS